MADKTTKFESAGTKQIYALVLLSTVQFSTLRCGWYVLSCLRAQVDFLHIMPGFMYIRCEFRSSILLKHLVVTGPLSPTTALIHVLRTSFLRPVSSQHISAKFPIFVR